MKILNLFCGIGGNRADWDSSHKVTACDSDPLALEIYRNNFPDDIAVCSDAYALCLQEINQHDLVWASPPCTSHSRFRLCKDPAYTDLRLYELIILLQNFHRGLWVVENVEPYYPSLIPSIKRGRHRIWSNFYIPEFNVPDLDLMAAGVEELRSFHGYDICRGVSERKLLRNMCHRKIGEEVCYAAVKEFEGSASYIASYQSDWLRRFERDESEMRN